MKTHFSFRSKQEAAVSDQGRIPGRSRGQRTSPDTTTCLVHPLVQGRKRRVRECSTCFPACPAEESISRSHLLMNPPMYLLKKELTPLFLAFSLPERNKKKEGLRRVIIPGTPTSTKGSRQHPFGKFQDLSKVEIVDQRMGLTGTSFNDVEQLK